MTALANTLERLASADSEHQRSFSEAVIDDYEYLLELANDVYIASLDTHVASLEYFGISR